MTRSTKAVPDGSHSVTPYLVVPGVARLLEFLKEAFDAQETVRAARGDGSIAHAAARIGDSIVEMGESTGEWTPMPANLHLDVKNSDEVYSRGESRGSVPV